MNNFLRMCLNIITQIGPYLVVLLLWKYLVNLQQKRAKEREGTQIVPRFVFMSMQQSGMRMSALLSYM